MKLIRKLNGEKDYILSDTEFEEFQAYSFWYIVNYVLDTVWTVFALSFIWISYRTDYPKVKPILWNNKIVLSKTLNNTVIQCCTYFADAVDISEMFLQIRGFRALNHTAGIMNPENIRSEK